MKHVFFLLVLFGFQMAHAQQGDLKFGEITQEDIALKSYNLDREAGAVIIFDVGESMFYDWDGGYDIRFTRHKRIKILKESAFEYAEISIPYYVDGYGKTETVKAIQAVTYNNENGRLIPTQLNQATIYQEKISERWWVKKFVFPNVQEGSILELKYVLETPFHFNLPDWTFQDKIPTMYSEYEIRMIPFYEYVFIAQGITSFDYQNSVIAKEKRSWGSVASSYERNVGSGVEFTDYVHTYALKNVPAFKDESYISSINDYIMKMDFQLAKFHSPTGSTTDVISTWQELNKALIKNEHFGKYQKSCERYAKKILAETPGMAEEPEKTRSRIIIEYLKNNFTWNGYYSKYASQSAKDFYNSKTGNSADINLFLVALLNYAGIEAQPVILSTRDHGKIRSDYPFDHFTNYVIALVKSDPPFLADATENLLPYNKIPTRCMNEKGLVVNDEKEIQWLKLENNIPSIENNTILIEVNPETLTASVNVSIQSTEYDAYNFRNKFNNDTTALKAQYTEKVGEITSLKTLNYDRVSLPYSISFQGNTELEKIGDMLVINPFLNLSPAKNDLTQKERDYPVDIIYPNNEVFEITLYIPEGYKLSALPEPYTLDNNLVEIKIDYTATKELLKIDGNYYFKKPMYVSTEYAKIKAYTDKIVEKFNEEVVLEKIQ